MPDYAAARIIVVDAQGEMGVCEIAPIICNHDVLDIGIRQMVANVQRFEYIITDSELEALVLECNLIKLL